MARILKSFVDRNYFLVFLFLMASFTELGYCQDEEEEAGGGDEEEAGPEPEKMCQVALIELILNSLPITAKCMLGGSKHFKLQTIFDVLPRFYCSVKCIFTELGVFSDDGLLDEVAALLYFQEALPEYALGPIVEKAQPCLALAAQFDPKEYYCQSYSPFVQCLAGTLVTAIGPFGLDCFGTPIFGGVFGLLNFVVPPARPKAGGEGESKKIMAPKRNNLPVNLDFNRLAKLLFSPQMLIPSAAKYYKSSLSHQRKSTNSTNLIDTSASNSKFVAGSKNGDFNYTSRNMFKTAQTFMNRFWNNKPPIIKSS